jgi:hypothetical protein
MRQRALKSPGAARQLSLFYVFTMSRPPVFHISFISYKSVVSDLSD